MNWNNGINQLIILPERVKFHFIEIQCKNVQRNIPGVQWTRGQSALQHQFSPDVGAPKGSECSY
jgi:hypothetical protein